MSKQSQLNGFIRSVPQPKHKGKKREQKKKNVRGEKNARVSVEVPVDDDQ